MARIGTERLQAASRVRGTVRLAYQENTSPVSSVRSLSIHSFIFRLHCLRQVYIIDHAMFSHPGHRVIPYEEEA